MLDPWRHDLWLAARGLLRARGFALTVVLTLALGVGGATVMFALIEGVLLRPMPVRDQERLVVAWKELRLGSAPHWPIPRSEIEAIGEGSRLVESVAGVSYNGAQGGVMMESGEPVSIASTYVTGAFFDVLGVEPVLGRGLKPADDVEGAENVLVISHDLWQRRYGGSPDVLGRRLGGDEHTFTIVGVMPPDLAYPPGVQAWSTVTATASTATNPVFREAIANELDLVARLRPGVTVEQARGELQGLIGRLEDEGPPGGPRGSRVVLQSLSDVVVGHVRTPMVALFAAVGLLLLIATANAANLLLLRSETRQGELAVRAALGARPGRLARQHLAEGATVGLASGVAGLSAAWWALPAVVALVPGGLPRVESIRIDPAVGLFALGAGVLAGVLAAAAPARRSTLLDVASRLGGGRQVGYDRNVQRARRTLVAAQVALAVMIVAAAGLLTRSVLRLQGADMGFAGNRLIFVGLGLPQPRFAEPGRHLQFLKDVVARLEAAPEIAAATPVNNIPFVGTGGWDVGTFTAEGQGFDRVQTNPSLNFEAVHPGYFEALGVTIVRGRGFTERDRSGAPEVVVLSEEVATHLWPGQDPLGKRLKFGGPDDENAWRTVVGVVGTTRYRELAQPRSTLYVPAEQLFVSAGILVLRTTSPVALAARLARQGVRAVDPGVEVTWVAPFTRLLERPLARPRFDAFLIGVFGLAALLLAVIGLYAVMGTWVRQRHGELGIRMALGAAPSDVRHLVLGEGLRLAIVGAAPGLGGALVTTRALEGLLFEVRPLDPLSLLGAALLLIGASALASFLPARRASRVDPLEVLRAI